MNKKIIKSKIKSTENIKKITKTMEMVSVAKMRKAVQLAEDYKTFGQEAKRILSILADQKEKNIYSLHNDSDYKLLIVIAGQKGLCGGYNSNIYRYINRVYGEDIKNKTIKFITIGKYAEKIARRFDKGEEGDSIILSFNQVEFLSKDARVIVKNLSESYLNKEFSKVDLVYTDFENINSMQVVSNTLLPFNSNSIDVLKDISEDDKTDDLEYVFEPNIKQVYEYTIRILLQNIILGSVLRARASEHAARMMAMKTATDNASEMISELKLWYNKARQAAITQEIAEISSSMIAK
ncbi:MAG: F-type H+-transporting ATPase subunit gamma [Patescibacteria group bacterium]|nr:F-type H+-transporting ATPase subunit gamma [Patescibacteria group bacterium]